MINLQQIALIEKFQAEKERLSESNKDFRTRVLNHFRYHPMTNVESGYSGRLNVNMNQIEHIMLNAFIGMKLAHAKKSNGEKVLTDSFSVILPTGQRVRLSKFDIYVSEKVTEVTIEERTIYVPSKWLEVIGFENWRGAVYSEWLMSKYKKGKKGTQEFIDDYNESKFLIENYEAYKDDLILEGKLITHIGQIKNSIVSEFKRIEFCDKALELGMEWKKSTLALLKEAEDAQERVSGISTLLNMDKPYTAMLEVIKEKVKESEPHFDIDESTIEFDFQDDNFWVYMKEKPYSGRYGSHTDSSHCQIKLQEILERENQKEESR